MKKLSSLVHDFRNNYSTINFALTTLRLESAASRHNEFEDMLSRNLASAQSILTELGAHPWPGSTSEDGLEMQIEVRRLFDYLQTNRSTLAPGQLQDQLDLLITTLRSVLMRAYL